MFGSLDEVDPQQSSNEVVEKAYCLALGQRGGADRTFDYVVPTNEWVHIAITCKSVSNAPSSPSTLSLFVNGSFRDSLSMKFNLPVATIGSTRMGQSYFGSIAELRIWSYARSAGEISRDMKMDVSGKFLQHKLIAHLQCNE